MGSTTDPARRLRQHNGEIRAEPGQPVESTGNLLAMWAGLRIGALPLGKACKIPSKGYTPRRLALLGLVNGDALLVGRIPRARESIFVEGTCV